MPLLFVDSIGDGSSVVWDNCCDDVADHTCIIGGYPHA